MPGLTDLPPSPDVVMRGRPLGMVLLEQDAPEGGRAPRAECRTGEQTPACLREEIERFFLNVTVFQHKNAQILGWEGPDRAREAVERLSRGGR